jgi:hypothetical protein
MGGSAGAGRGKLRRPEAVSCGWCGAQIAVQERGRVPRWCGSGCRHRAWEATPGGGLGTGRPGGRRAGGDRRGPRTPDRSGTPVAGAADARKIWLGPDDRGVELEIVAVVLPGELLIIHVMPTALGRKP